MKNLFDSSCFDCSKLITNAYSTSFSLGTMLLDSSIRKHIYAIYGFVRFADEIVDTFHDFDKKVLLEQFIADTYTAIEKGISLNPILNSFQHTVRTYGIEREVIDAFLNSMRMDLYKSVHNEQSYKNYIYGSAEVVGLMCLSVFVEGNKEKYERLKEPALRLGAAFQKVNFLRDMQHDFKTLGRIYFPGIQIESFDAETKRKIEEDIEADFKIALEGIKKLPKTCQLGVYVAYRYYYTLFNKIKNIRPEKVLQSRIRIPNAIKIYLLTRSYFKLALSLA